MLGLGSKKTKVQTQKVTPKGTALNKTEDKKNIATGRQDNTTEINKKSVKKEKASSKIDLNVDLPIYLKLYELAINSVTGDNVFNGVSDRVVITGEEKVSAKELNSRRLGLLNEELQGDSAELSDFQKYVAAEMRTKKYPKHLYEFCYTRQLFYGLFYKISESYTLPVVYEMTLAVTGKTSQQYRGYLEFLTKLCNTLESFGLNDDDFKELHAYAVNSVALKILKKEVSIKTEYELLDMEMRSFLAGVNELFEMHDSQWKSIFYDGVNIAPAANESDVDTEYFNEDKSTDTEVEQTFDEEDDASTVPEPHNDLTNEPVETVEHRTEDISELDLEDAEVSTDSQSEATAGQLQNIICYLSTTYSMRSFVHSSYFESILAKLLLLNRIQLARSIMSMDVAQQKIDVVERNEIAAVNDIRTMDSVFKGIFTQDSLQCVIKELLTCEYTLGIYIYDNVLDSVQCNKLLAPYLTTIDGHSVVKIGTNVLLLCSVCADIELPVFDAVDIAVDLETEVLQNDIKCTQSLTSAIKVAASFIGIGGNDESE